MRYYDSWSEAGAVKLAREEVYAIGRLRTQPGFDPLKRNPWVRFQP